LTALSVPCAAGEEAYSIAVTLREAGLKAGRYTVDAVDVSRRAIERAAAGVFRETSFRGPDFVERSQFVEAVPEGWAIKPEVKAAIRFRVANLLDPAAFPGETRYDVVFCRNLLIYLDGPARKLAVAVLERLTKPGGLLVVGHAEASLVPRVGFEPDPDRRTFAFVRTVPAGPPTGSGAQRLAAFRRSIPPRPERSSPPAAMAAPVQIAPASAADMLAEAESLANQRRHAEAAARCEEAIRLHGPSAKAYALLGTITAVVDPPRAESAFQKAIYLDPSDADSLLALAFLADRRGDPQTAQRYRARAERAHRAGEGA
jgi:chemotaxis protein methyltransferase WspC